MKNAVAVTVAALAVSGAYAAPFPPKPQADNNSNDNSNQPVPGGYLAEGHGRFQPVGFAHDPQATGLSPCINRLLPLKQRFASARQCLEEMSATLYNVHRNAAVSGRPYDARFRATQMEMLEKVSNDVDELRRQLDELVVDKKDFEDILSRRAFFKDAHRLLPSIQYLDKETNTMKGLMEDTKEDIPAGIAVQEARLRQLKEKWGDELPALPEDMPPAPQLNDSHAEDESSLDSEDSGDPGSASGYSGDKSHSNLDRSQVSHFGRSQNSKSISEGSRFEPLSRGVSGNSVRFEPLSREVSGNSVERVIEPIPEELDNHFILDPAARAMMAERLNTGAKTPTFKMMSGSSDSESRVPEFRPGFKFNWKEFKFLPISNPISKPKAASTLSESDIFDEHGKIRFQKSRFEGLVDSDIDLVESHEGFNPAQLAQSVAPPEAFFFNDDMIVKAELPAAPSIQEIENSEDQDEESEKSSEASSSRSEIPEKSNDDEKKDSDNDSDDENPGTAGGTLLQELVKEQNDNRETKNRGEYEELYGSESDENKDSEFPMTESIEIPTSQIVPKKEDEEFPMTESIEISANQVVNKAEDKTEESHTSESLGRPASQIAPNTKDKKDGFPMSESIEITAGQIASNADDKNEQAPNNGPPMYESQEIPASQIAASADDKKEEFPMSESQEIPASQIASKADDRNEQESNSRLAMSGSQEIPAKDVPAEMKFNDDNGLSYSFSVPADIDNEKQNDSVVREEKEDSDDNISIKSAESEEYHPVEPWPLADNSNDAGPEKGLMFSFGNLPEQRLGPDEHNNDEMPEGEDIPMGLSVSGLKGNSRPAKFEDKDVHPMFHSIMFRRPKADAEENVPDTNLEAAVGSDEVLYPGQVPAAAPSQLLEEPKKEEAYKPQEELRNQVPAERRFSMYDSTRIDNSKLPSTLGAMTGSYIPKLLDKPLDKKDLPVTVVGNELEIMDEMRDSGRFLSHIVDEKYRVDWAGNRPKKVDEPKRPEIAEDLLFEITEADRSRSLDDILAELSQEEIHLQQDIVDVRNEELQNRIADSIKAFPDFEKFDLAGRKSDGIIQPQAEALEPLSKNEMDVAEMSFSNDDEDEELQRKPVDIADRIFDDEEDGHGDEKAKTILLELKDREKQLQERLDKLQSMADMYELDFNESEDEEKEEVEIIQNKEDDEAHDSEEDDEVEIIERKPEEIDQEEDFEIIRQPDNEIVVDEPVEILSDKNVKDSGHKDLGDHFEVLNNEEQNDAAAAQDLDNYDFEPVEEDQDASQAEESDHAAEHAEWERVEEDDN